MLNQYLTQMNIDIDKEFMFKRTSVSVQRHNRMLIKRICGGVQPRLKTGFPKLIQKISDRSESHPHRESHVE